uniref:Uncharacterized protein n=1 Tax=Fervidicoccus fontis TaxID=683846 RepID=A0A7J3ZJ92_9CREN
MWIGQLRYIWTRCAYICAAKLSEIVKAMVLCSKRAYSTLRTLMKIRHVKRVRRGLYIIKKTV